MLLGAKQHVVGTRVLETDHGLCRLYHGTVHGAPPPPPPSFHRMEERREMCVCGGA